MKKIFSGLLVILLLSIRPAAQNVGIGTDTPAAMLDVNGDVIFRTGDLVVADGITLALDVTSTKFSYYRITGPTADFTLAGITAAIDGRLLTLFNRSGFAMQLINEDVTVTPADQIMTGTDADVIIPHKGIINLQYDATEQKWIVKSSSKAGATVAAGSLWDINGNDIFNTNNGNVGIGINTPLTPLHIKKDLEALRIEGTSPYISFYNDGGVDPKTFIQNTNDDLYLGTSTGNPAGIMQFYLNNAPRMTLLPAGNVGIGTAAPADKLTVQTAGASYGLTHTDGIVTVGTWIGTAGFFPGGWVGTKSNHPLNFFTAGGVSKMTIYPDGNIIVGDNTTVPYGRFTVRTGNNTDGISHIGNDGNILATRMGGTSAGIGTFSNTHMRIFCHSRSDIFIAAATGNVGIGTENFGTYKLQVNGSVRSTEVVVETGWADYVFDKNYKLKPLDEVEKFIEQNKHLPGILSAAEIEKNGLHLGDTQKRMMEKIEELTLYVIGLKKEIDLLKNEKK